MITEKVQQKKERPPSLGGGPLGLGDPNDTQLRKTEKDILIPKIMREEARKRCPETLQKFLECCKNEGFLYPFRCRKENEDNNECMNEWANKPEFREEITKKYLEARSHYRRTGEALEKYIRK